MAEHLWSVQTGDGRAVITWRSAEPAYVGDVTADRTDGKVRLLHKMTVMAEADDPGGDLHLYRWPVDAANPSDWKTKPPTSKQIESPKADTHGRTPDHDPGRERQRAR